MSAKISHGDNTEIGCNTGCGCFVILFNLLLGGWSVNAILGWLGHNIPFWADSLIGLFAGEISIPIAIIGSILRLFGVF